jgi:hypothetical protein
MFLKYGMIHQEEKNAQVVFLLFTTVRAWWMHAPPCTHDLAGAQSWSSGAAAASRSPVPADARKGPHA